MLKYKERLEKINEEDGGGGDMGDVATLSNTEGMGNPSFPVADNVGSGDKWAWGGVVKIKNKTKNKKPNINKVSSFKDFFKKGKEVQPK